MLGMPKRTPTDHTTLIAGHLGQWLRAQREAGGMTQEQLAQRSGLSRNQVQNLENNRNNNTSGRMSANPSLDTLVALESVFDMELGELLVAVRQRMKEQGAL